MTPRELGYRWPAEWEPHRATWLVWPHNRDTWPGRFVEAQRQYAQFVRTVARFEHVELLVPQALQADAAAQMGDMPNVTLRDFHTNDSWIRDHGPIFLNRSAGQQPSLLLKFDYNAWGNKYPPHDRDNRVPGQVAEWTKHELQRVPMVLEGGSVEGNGAGVVLTTEPCLLNPNRNPQMSRAQIERVLHDYLLADHIIWLTGEIAGDDTDSHIDQIARFTDANTVVTVDDGHSQMFRENSQRLNAWRRVSGRDLTIVRLPMPQPRRDGDMDLPMSYANFCVVNGAVLVPVFRDVADDQACELLAQCFPQREIVPVPSDDLVYGLGSLHCLSQQEPVEAVA